MVVYCPASHIWVFLVILHHSLQASVTGSLSDENLIYYRFK